MFRPLSLPIKASRVLRTWPSSHVPAHLYNTASNAGNRVELTKQRHLYQELLKRKAYGKLITEFELQYPDDAKFAQKRLIQLDAECISAYAHALEKDGQGKLIFSKIAALMAANSAQDHYETLKSSSDSAARNSASSSTPLSSATIAGTEGKPIHVLVSTHTTWGSWFKGIILKYTSYALGFVLISYILDRQGYLNAFKAQEIQPVKMETRVTFAEVQGVDEAKEELEEVVAFLKEPMMFTRLGGKLPKGILLYGPPGTGKTQLARAVAGEAGVPFFQVSGSEFEEMYVGLGAKRVRELFAAAKKRAPCIIFIDELDAVGSKRSSKDQAVLRQTLNQLLTEMDGFSGPSGIVVIGATNSPESLDAALIRPGRFDKKISVPLPDVKGRAEILKAHMKNVTRESTLTMDVIARGTPGFSGADLANLVNQAAIKAAKDGSRCVMLGDLEWAKDKISMGAERKSALITPKNKLLTAYHEGGHALAAIFTDNAMPLHKVTVMPRGSALGLTWQLPAEDQLNYTRKQLFATLDVCMGGRIAEEMFGGADEVSTGASSDLEKATSIARGMVSKYGMGKKTGYMVFSDESWSTASQEIKTIVEGEISEILHDSYARTTKLLKEKEAELHKLAEALVEFETLDADQVKHIIQGGDIRQLPKSK